MKTLIKSILFIGSLLITTSLFAQNNEHKHEGANKAGMHQGMTIPHENMGEMHKKMMEMKKEVHAIKTEKDPDKQQQMMVEHHRSMMKMMQLK